MSLLQAELQVQSDVYDKKDVPVSIIILTYNGSKYICELLRSLAEQSYPAELMETIVVDNASTDETISLVHRDNPDVTTIVMNDNVGFAAGNNRAIDYANHDYLVFLNQDTVCHKDWLKGLVSAIRQDNNIAVCTSNLVLSETFEFARKQILLPAEELCYYDLTPFGYASYRRNSNARFVFSRIFSGCSFIIQRKTIDHLGGLFDEDLTMYVEDTDVSLRIHNVGQKICVVKDSIVYHLHDSPTAFNAHCLRIAIKAITNRVYVFFKNMSTIEFVLFCPFLICGGVFKIFSLRTELSKKILYFLPFALFSTACMFVALFRLSRYAGKRRDILKGRSHDGLPILKLLFKPVKHTPC